MAGADSATQYTEHLTASNRAIGRSLLITLRDDKTDLPVSEISLDIPGKYSWEGLDRNRFLNDCFRRGDWSIPWGHGFIC